MKKKDYLTEKWELQLKKVFYPYIILRKLSEGECYGYFLLSYFKNEMNIGILEGTLYPLLIKLEADNLVKSNWIQKNSGLPRKYYIITEEGISVVSKMEKSINIYLKKIFNE